MPHEHLGSIVAILRGVTPERAVAVGHIVFEAGISAIEVPLNSPQPFDSIAKLSAALGASCLCGAGTVLDPADVRRAHDAGAHLIVSPNTNPEVIAATVERQMIAMPGFATATEAFAGIDAGAAHLKLFPAASYGVGHLKALKAVLPKHVGVYAVGGVGADDVGQWFSAGAVGFGFGSELFKPDYSDTDIAARAKRLVEIRPRRHAEIIAGAKKPGIEGEFINLGAIDIAVVVGYAISIFLLAQYVSREKAGHVKDSKDYFLASKTLPWWAIGTSLIAANISAEQIIGMSGSGYALGLGIASYEWMSALTLLIVGKFFLPIFLKNQIYTMPEFLQRRYGTSVRFVMAVFWLGLYILVNLTAILWLGATAVHVVTGVPIEYALVGLGLFAGAYALYGGLKAVALTDIVQVTLLVLGGLVIAYIALEKISGGTGLHGVIDGFQTLQREMPNKFQMILKPDNPYYKDLPGLSVLIGGMWIMNLSYWGFNQYIIQRALAAKDTREAQKGIVLASFLKLLMPVLVVLPGIAASVLAPHLEKPDQAYPYLMTLLPPGLLGLVFAALIAAIIASMGSKINSIATIFTIDLYKPFHRNASERYLVVVGRITAVVALAIAMLAAKPLLGSFDQVFQAIQEYTGFVTPGIVVIFLLGMFWSRATTAGAFVATVGSVVMSFAYKLYAPQIPFMNRVGYVFLLCLAAAVAVSLLQPKPKTSTVDLTEIDYSTSASFNIAGVIVIGILIALYYTFW